MSTVQPSLLPLQLTVLGPMDGVSAADDAAAADAADRVSQYCLPRRQPQGRTVGQTGGHCRQRMTTLLEGASALSPRAIVDIIFTTGSQFDRHCNVRLYASLVSVGEIDRRTDK